jgi:SAM-dependent methyltransferase
MNTQTIQRQYNEVVAPYYDLDPQGVYTGSVNRAAAQLERLHLLDDGGPPLKVLDVGMGTGRFLARLKALAGDQIQPFGLDMAEKMVESARRKIPDLVAEFDDAANLGAHFQGHSFDLVCTHYITGYVPIDVLAPKIRERIEEGGYWSFVGGTKAGFPALQARASSKLLRWVVGAGSQTFAERILNPADEGEVVRALQANGFEVCESQTYEPALEFRDFDQFMEFAYRGGWLTPILEALGLHQAGPVTRLLLNWFFFPIKDHHNIAIALARKIGT